ncbi:MAG TPA: hypothetical protein VM327_02575 [Candidatus Thermoplasmatota archaeon]|nr:hypothetical protein [Candidatus Thermoplasmatota archaeon]
MSILVPRQGPSCSSHRFNCPAVGVVGDFVDLALKMMRSGGAHEIA